MEVKAVMSLGLAAAVHYCHTAIIEVITKSAVCLEEVTPLNALIHMEMVGMVDMFISMEEDIAKLLRVDV